MTYKFHIQYDKAKNYVKYTSNCFNWTRIVNRKPYNASTNELMEDLVVTPDIFIDVLISLLSDGVTYIMTFFNMEECLILQVTMEENN